MIKDGYVLSPTDAGPHERHTQPRALLMSAVVGFICLVGTGLACMIQFAYSPSIGTHLFIALPPVIIACAVPCWLMKNWLAGDRFCSEVATVLDDRNRVGK